MAVEDFKPAEHGLKVEIVSADHQNKPDVGAGIARQWYDRDGVDMIIDGVTSSVALAVSQVTKEKNKVFLDTGAGTVRPHRHAVHAQHHPLGLRHRGARQRHRRRHGQARRRHVVLPHRRLRVRPGARARHHARSIAKNGGKVVGAVKTPFPTADFSSFLLQAQGSGAKVIGLANAGGDTINSIKQAGEFGIIEGGQALAGLLVFSSDVHSLGTKVAQGLVLTEPFYWDLNDATRAFSDRVRQADEGLEAHRQPCGRLFRRAPLSEGGGARRRRPRDGAAIVAKMKEHAHRRSAVRQGQDPRRRPQDPRHVPVRGEEAGRVQGRVGLYKMLATIPGDQAFRPLKDGNCPLVKG